MKKIILLSFLLLLNTINLYSKPLNIAIIWNDHQPDYYDSNKNIFLKPWVRLHCLKDYYDMAKRVEKFKNLNCNFNLSSSLLKQLDLYINNNSEDIMMKLHKKTYSELTKKEKIYLISRCFDINWNNYIKTSKRYWNLLKKRGFNEFSDSLNIALKKFTEQDFIDMQVHFNLAWCDKTIINSNPYLKLLVSKDKNYNYSDLKKILKIQLQYMKLVKLAYKKLIRNKNFEIITTPLYHPILPLIYDTHSAPLNKKNVAFPRFQYPEDANDQVKLALNYYYELFGKNTKGMWPPEGAISEDSVDLLAKNNISWIATDEKILSKTLGISFNRKKNIIKNTEILYRPYKYISKENRTIYILFRDSEISNSISFSYQGIPYKTAVSDLINKLMNIKKNIKYKNKDHLVTIILDGENCWEKYENDGADFLDELYMKLSNNKDLKTVTISNYLKKCNNIGILTKIHAGSWVNADFSTWIGENEENTAWTYLKIVRDIVEDEYKRKNISKEKYNNALNEIYKAEGSDWFWWYGIDQNSGIDSSFDEIFRTHLINVFKIMNKRPLELLKKPIVAPAHTPIMRSQFGTFNAIIDGTITSANEWYGSGYVFDNEEKTNVADIISSMHFGINKKILNIRFDGDMNIASSYEKDFKLYIYINNPNIKYAITPNKEKIRNVNTTFNEKIVINLKNKKIEFFTVKKDLLFHKKKFNGKLKINSCCELSLTNYSSNIEILCLVKYNNNIIDVIPNYGTLYINSKLSQKIKFVFKYPSAKKVALAGDFNEWNKNNILLKKNNDHWEIEIPLFPGTYKYKYIVNDNIWLTDPFSKINVDDGYGNKNSVIKVK